MLEALAVVYHNDASAREQKLSPQARLEFHQAESGPMMEELHAWLARQFDQRLVEPNSALGEAIAYLLKHWEKLTLFLRVPGAPLDNNICERALKKAILHRKNALFYKTLRGARVGDLFMSLIHTCELCGANPFDYLTELERHAAELSSHPQDWMPWNYRQTLAASTTPVSRSHLIALTDLPSQPPRRSRFCRAAARTQCIRSRHPGVANAGMLDGSVRSIKEDIDPTVLKGLFTIAGGEPFSWE